MFTVCYKYNACAMQEPNPMKEIDLQNVYNRRLHMELQKKAWNRAGGILSKGKRVKGLFANKTVAYAELESSRKYIPDS